MAVFPPTFGTTILGAPMYAPDATFSNASPQIFVEVYPSVVGAHSYQFNNNVMSDGGVISAVVDKNIRTGDGGRFIIQLTPGGPQGVDSLITWTRILTILSTVVIGLSRGSSNRIVMVGVLTSIHEGQAWDEEGHVVRTIDIQGFDLTYYFTAFSYYMMTYLGILSANTIVGVSGALLGLTGGSLYGNVDGMGQQYLTKVMLGTGSTANPGVLQNTFINYKINDLLLRNIFGYVIEAFIALGTPVFFPLLIDFLNSEGAWLDKFSQIFRFPYYEFYVITANQTDYPNLGTLPNTDAGGYSFLPSSSFSMQNFPNVYPIIVARVNPQPWVGIIPSTNTPTSLNHSQWDALPIYNYNNWGFISSDVNYSLDDFYNLFMVTTTDASMIQKQYGGPIQFFASEILGVNYSPYSIAKYGYRMHSVDLKWLTSYYAAGVSSTTLDTYSTVLLGMSSSFHLPLPNMLSGTVRIPMWPSVMPGCKFTYNPFKAQEIYEFYIEGVTHTYKFGGPSFTTLTLSRGLLQSDYANSTVVQGLLTDTYTLTDGILQSRTTAPPYQGLIFDKPGNSNLSMYPNMIGTPSGP